MEAIILLIVSISNIICFFLSNLRKYDIKNPYGINISKFPATFLIKLGENNWYLNISLKGIKLDVDQDTSWNVTT